MANDSVPAEGNNADERFSEYKDYISNRTISTSSACSSNKSVSETNNSVNQGGSFGDVNVYECTDVLVGNKVGITGDVTINQYIYPNGVDEKYPNCNNLPTPKDVYLKSKNGDISLKNGRKNHPIVHITQQRKL